MNAAGGQAGARSGRLAVFTGCRGKERRGVRIVRLHVQHPFADAFHVFFRQAAVGVDDAFDVGVDAALETIGGGWDDAPRRRAHRT